MYLKLTEEIERALLASVFNQAFIVRKSISAANFLNKLLLARAVTLNELGSFRFDSL
ncbi:hypothetical protein [secondary endosymbiont of Ctenarytaina eucalypti]|uniref:hypothetical protein n=1 Tax=secondary endosymbiont of Ctenarytaina eucalypti TaxID=1199245 RepID=UPI0002DB7207|nr:hypothetical protein [secondary endosymbiont of Ctenarytaina eucalypti]